MQIQTLLRVVRRVRTWVWSTYVRVVESRKFERAYVLGALAILLGTTSLWSYWGAIAQADNADQLVDAQLFGDSATLHGAVLPGQHTFLLKWPLFWLMRSMGLQSSTYVGVTIGLSIVAVGVLAWILYRIERRPLVIGGVYLALSSILLLVPAQPYPGALLPVNMAMITTRNIEYVIYVIVLWLLIRYPSYKRWQFWTGVVGLAVLSASDKLFVTLTAGAALLALLAYGLLNRWKLVNLSGRLVSAVIVAVVISGALLTGVSALHFVHIANSNGTNPYGLVPSVHTAMLGGLYAILGLLTNFGANPIADPQLVRTFPGQLIASFHSWTIIAYLINFILLCSCIWAAARLCVLSVKTNAKHKIRADDAYYLSLFMVWVAVVGVAIFVATNHEYAVDARYLGFVPIALLVAFVVYNRRRAWRPLHVVSVGWILLLAVGIGLPAAMHSSAQAQVQSRTIAARNTLVAQALSYHHVDRLVGDYWRVVPIRQASGNNLAVMPMQTCLQPRDVLSSSTWRADLESHSFAYLLSRDKSQTDYPACNLDDVVAAYGRPNASVTIAGSLDNPTEQLLFYDKGAHKSSPDTKPRAQGPATVVPISLEDLPYTTCNGPTLMNIVAHQDDDLLFMNPDLLTEIQAQHCVRTVYLTAGDAGQGDFYWLNRELGAQAAYAKMTHTDNVWIRRIVKLDNKQYLTVITPNGNPKASLIFMHLPDGNTKGQGFRTSHYENLDRLLNGSIPAIHSVDGQSSYTADDVTSALTRLMQTYLPAEIHTQSSYGGHVFHDHSDHMAVGVFAKRAYQTYESRQYENRVVIPFKLYMGYSAHELSVNVFGKELDEKIDVFLTYAAFDGAVCSSRTRCLTDPAYGAYLQRQHKSSF